MSIYKTTSSVFSKSVWSNSMLITAFAGTLMLAGCQKTDDTANETLNENDPKVAEVASNSNKDNTSTDTEIKTKADDKASEQLTTTTDTPNSDSPDISNDTAVSKVSVSNNAELADPNVLDDDRPLTIEEENALLEKQVTDVEYQSQTGESIKVTFQTSALETLEADVMLPNGQRVVLTAPEGQGNNPTYRSTDGNIELVTHGGGGSIDLLYNGKQTKFEAVSAEAEVISVS